MSCIQRSQGNEWFEVPHFTLILSNFLIATQPVCLGMCARGSASCLKEAASPGFYALREKAWNTKFFNLFIQEAEPPGTHSQADPGNERRCKTGVNGTLKGCHNGVLLGTSTMSSGAISNYGSTAGTGKHWWDNARQSSARINGIFDDIRTYNRALSASEIQTLYAE